MTRETSPKLPARADDTTEGRTSSKPELSWDQDAHTVLRPVDAIIPAAAFRDTLPPAKMRRSRGRWLLLACATLLSCAMAYTAFSVLRKLEPRAATRSPGAASPSIEAALGEVLDEVQGKVKSFIVGVLKPAPPTPATAAGTAVRAPERKVEN